jgi:hypothetical protein
MEEEKNATKEPFDTTPFAQLLFGPRGRQTGAIFYAKLGRAGLAHDDMLVGALVPLSFRV